MTIFQPALEKHSFARHIVYQACIWPRFIKPVFLQFPSSHTLRNGRAKIDHRQNYWFQGKIFIIAKFEKRACLNSQNFNEPLQYLTFSNKLPLKLGDSHACIRKLTQGNSLSSPFKHIRLTRPLRYIYMWLSLEEWINENTSGCPTKKVSPSRRNNLQTPGVWKWIESL